MLPRWYAITAGQQGHTSLLSRTSHQRVIILNQAASTSGSWKSRQPAGTAVSTAPMISRSDAGILQSGAGTAGSLTYTALTSNTWQKNGEPMNPPECRFRKRAPWMCVMKPAIIFYSYSGITREIAERIRKECGGDLIEIRSKENYTAVTAYTVGCSQGEKRERRPDHPGSYRCFRLRYPHYRNSRLGLETVAGDQCCNKGYPWRGG